MDHKQGHWDKLYHAELYIARAHRTDINFHGILCDHALIMIEALRQQHPERGTGKTHFALGMLLGVVHCNWIALLRSRVSREHSDTLRSISDLLARSSQLLVSLITEDRLCTMAELTKSEELEAIAGMHTRMGAMCKGLLKFFRNYVASLCHLYQVQFSPAAEDDANDVASARYWVLFQVVALGRMLDNVLETA